MTGVLVSKHEDKALEREEPVRVREEARRGEAAEESSVTDAWTLGF